MSTTVLAASIDSGRQRVLTQAVVEAARRLAIGPSDIAEVIGKSQPTASRLLSGKYLLADGKKEWELSAHFVRLYRSLSSVVGGNDELAREWLNSPNRAFDGQMPMAVIKRVEGLIHACEYLDARRARV